MYSLRTPARSPAVTEIQTQATHSPTQRGCDLGWSWNDFYFLLYFLERMGDGDGRQHLAEPSLSLLPQNLGLWASSPSIGPSPHLTHPPPHPPPPPSPLLCSRFLPASVSHHCVSCLTVSLTLQPPREPAFSLTFLSSLINVSFKNRLRSIFIPRIGLKFYGLH